jgi:hypothetical protein
VSERDTDDAGRAVLLGASAPPPMSAKEAFERGLPAPEPAERHTTPLVWPPWGYRSFNP